MGRKNGTGRGERTATADKEPEAWATECLPHKAVTDKVVTFETMLKNTIPEMPRRKYGEYEHEFLKRLLLWICQNKLDEKDAVMLKADVVALQTQLQELPKEVENIFQVELDKVNQENVFSRLFTVTEVKALQRDIIQHIKKELGCVEAKQ